MESYPSPRKKLKSPVYVGAISKTSITCTNVPESLLDASAAKKHFLKFGKAQKIQLMPKRHMCIVEYDQPLSAQRAVLNAGAYDGFMFEVTRTKPRVRRKSKREDDPDWLPDPDVEKELSAMGTTPVYRTNRQKPMDLEPVLDVRRNKSITRTVKQTLPRKTNIREKQTAMSQPQSITDSPSSSTVAQTVSTVEAAGELHQLRSRVALTPDEQWRLLDARDKILRSWGGAGSRVKVGGATIGTCTDMCPEKERLHRQAEYQVMTLETIPDSDGQLEPWRAVKQYTRSSADQEMPMCYELRPASVLMRTCAYLLHEIADTTRQVTLADWFHFMWDRLRGIRKDIAQQALCCAESIVLVEMCARFHAHCAARLADLEHTQFDQKLNTDNLTKCLQTLKHMYADATSEQKPREAEFRGYIALLNLGDANFWWEIKQLPLEIQKSEPILFSIQIFNALDNNNYVRFFRLVRDKATYLQACILLRYFNDVRARALVRIVKAYAPRGGSKYPAEELMNSLMFESVDHMQSFISHYGLHVGKTDELEVTVILDRNQLIEDSDPYPISRARSLIESKMRCDTVGEVIAGGQLQKLNYHNHILYSSFTKDGTLKEAALIAEDQGYNTFNDSNKNIQALKTELLRLSKTGRSSLSLETSKKILTSKDTLNKIDTSKGKSLPTFAPSRSKAVELFSFNPAIPVAPIEVIKDSPEKLYGDPSHVFSFSKPQATGPSFELAGNIFKSLKPQQSLDSQNKKIFGEINESDRGTQSFITIPKSDEHTFKKPNTENKNIFSNVIRGSSSNTFANKNLFTGSKDSLDGKIGSIFSKSSGPHEEAKLSSNIFNTFSKNPALSGLKKLETTRSAPNGDVTQNKLSPGSLFKSVISPSNGADAKNYSIFQTKNTPSVANSIFNSVNAQQNAKIYEFDENSDETQKQLELQLIEAKRKEELRKEEERKQELKLEEERRLKVEMQKKQELKLLEEKRKKEEEERKQEELRQKLEEEKKAELKRKAEEERKFKARVEQESSELTEELINDINVEIVKNTVSGELDRFNNLISCADIETEEILTELCNQICYSEMKAEKIWTKKMMKKWFYLWRKQFIRNKRRRNLLDDTPVWLTDNIPIDTATHFKRLAEKSALLNMNAIHRGYKFTGEFKQIPKPEPYNVLEIIRSSLLKRMKQICYPYDKCFFWKATVVSPGSEKWLYRKINIEKWLLDIFCDKKEHESESLLFVGKQSWNNLMNFAISISLLSDNNEYHYRESVEGTNGMLFYAVENDLNFINTIEDTLSQKNPYQIIPVAVIMPKTREESTQQAVEQLLITFVNNKTISAFKILIVDPENIYDSLNASTKSALKWMAKKYPQYPPLEINYLKTLCQTYLGNEIWHSLKAIQDRRVNFILKDFRKLVEFYNTALEKLTEIITNEDLYNYPTFPLEFNNYLDNSSPYPKPYEFITSKVKKSGYISSIRDMMKKLKLPEPVSRFYPVNVASIQNQIRGYCNQIGWFENNEVVCKVIAIMPNELCDENLTPHQFSQYFEQYDLVDVLNTVVYEKINSLSNLNDLYAVYDRSVLENYRNFNWLFDMNLLNSIKHKAIDYEDDLDLFIEAKRRKLALDSMEQLMLEDKDQTLVEESLKMTDENISKYSDCKKVVKELEETIEEERKKSLELENLLRTALGD